MTDVYQPSTIPASLALMLAMLPEDEADQLVRAFQFAAAAHADHFRDEGTPYIDHPVRVAHILWEELGYRDIEMLRAALNHDVLEDCDWLDRSVLADLIGEEATRMVEDVTKPIAISQLKADRDRVYLDTLAHLPLRSRLVKLADRIDNLRSIPKANNPAKATRYLEVSRAEFIPLALATDQTATRLIVGACDGVEEYLTHLKTT